MIDQTLLALVRLPPDDRAAALLALQPTAADLAAIFQPEAAYALRAARGENPTLSAPTASRVRVCTATASSLASPPLGFDRSYALVAPWLKPGTTWVSWTYLDERDEEIRRYEGLVVRPDRVCWCPRPWRFLAGLGLGQRSSVLDHWAH